MSLLILPPPPPTPAPQPPPAPRALTIAAVNHDKQTSFHHSIISKPSRSQLGPSDAEIKVTPVGNLELTMSL